MIPKGDLRRFGEWIRDTLLKSEIIASVGYSPKEVVSFAQRDFERRPQVPYYVVVGMPDAFGSDDSSNCFMWGLKATIAIGWDAEANVEVENSALTYMDFQWGVLEAFAKVIAEAKGHFRTIDIEVAKQSEFDQFRYLHENHWYSAYTIMTSAK